MTNRQYQQQKLSKRQKNDSRITVEGSNEEVLRFDVKALVERRCSFEHTQNGAGINQEVSPSGPNLALPERFSEIEVEISEQSSTGDGLGTSSTSDRVYVVPFTIPGDVVRAKIIHDFPKDHYTLTDFVKVIKPSPQRDESLVKCPYFAKCAGCQFQMLPYESQLRHKRTIVDKAFRNFSSLTPEVIPAVGDTIGSPLQYGYRTKLTPHFDGPPGSMSRKAKRNPAERKGFLEVPPIGFMWKGTRKTLDIEDCPIGTDAVREGIRAERKKIAEEIDKYKKGATILLRETTSRKPATHPSENIKSSTAIGKSDDAPTNLDHSSESKLDEPKDTETRVMSSGPSSQSSRYIEEKTYLTDQNAISTEYIDNFEFKNTAGAFFQNNNSILPAFTAYIRNHIMPHMNEESERPIKYLVDAYCGSGLFTVTLSSLFSSSMGIDIADTSIVSAKENAINNNVSNASFMTADASQLFREVTYPPEKTAVIIDPPRKGCDEAFLQQLLKFGPRRVVYVSCNVHTQARDIGVLVEGQSGCRYEIESLQGFDFFPQTSHVEGVAILSRSA